MQGLLSLTSCDHFPAIFTHCYYLPYHRPRRFQFVLLSISDRPSLLAYLKTKGNFKIANFELLMLEESVALVFVCIT